MTCLPKTWVEQGQAHTPREAKNAIIAAVFGTNEGLSA